MWKLLPIFLMLCSYNKSFFESAYICMCTPEPQCTRTLSLETNFYLKMLNKYSSIAIFLSFFQFYFFKFFQRIFVGFICNILNHLASEWWLRRTEKKKKMFGFFSFLPINTAFENEINKAQVHNIAQFKAKEILNW